MKHVILSIGHVRLLLQDTPAVERVVATLMRAEAVEFRSSYDDDRKPLIIEHERPKVTIQAISPRRKIIRPGDQLALPEKGVEGHV